MCISTRLYVCSGYMIKRAFLLSLITNSDGQTRDFRIQTRETNWIEEYNVMNSYGP